MQSKKQKPVQIVKKPLLHGGWHGKSARKIGLKLIPSILVVALLYFVLSLMLNFDALWLRVVANMGLVVAAGAYLYNMGMQRGESDAANGEIAFERRKIDKPLPADDEEACYHPLKGYCAALIGALPFMIVTLIYAFTAQPSLFQLGGMPSWVQSFMRQTEFGDALRYYEADGGITAYSIFRIVARALVMPFVSVGSSLSPAAALWVERLAPLWVLIAPMGYGLGYAQGERLRTRIHTGIAASQRRQKRRQQRERRQRTRKEPEQLI